MITGLNPAFTHSLPAVAYPITTASNPMQPDLSIIDLLQEIQESIARIGAVCSVLSIADIATGLQQGGEAWRIAQIIESEAGAIQAWIDSYFDATKEPEKLE